MVPFSVFIHKYLINGNPGTLRGPTNRNIVPAANLVFKQFKPSRGRVVLSYPAIAVVDFNDLCETPNPQPCNQIHSLESFTSHDLLIQLLPTQAPI